MNENKRNKSAVILNPEQSEWVSRSHVVSAELVVMHKNKRTRVSLNRDLYGPSLRSTLKMTVLTLILSLNLSAARAATDSGTCGNGCNWSYNTTTKELTLSGDGTMDSYAGKTKPWQSYLTTIETVKVANGSTLSNIGSDAFRGATSLISVDMPNVTRINSGAFENATSLTSVNMPNATMVGDWAFYNANSLTSVYMPSVTGLGSSSFELTPSLESVDMPNVTSIGPSCFRGATNLTYVGLSDANVDICCGGSSDAFYNSGVSGCSSTNRDDCGSCNSGDGKYLVSGQGCYTQAQCDSSEGLYFANNACNHMPKSKSDCQSADLLWGGSSCVKSCPSGQVDWKNDCYEELPFAKKHWTPAEAAQYLKDNDNEIIMTFKVNR